MEKIKKIVAKINESIKDAIRKEADSIFGYYKDKGETAFLYVYRSYYNDFSSEFIAGYDIIFLDNCLDEIVVRYSDDSYDDDWDIYSVSDFYDNLFEHIRIPQFYYSEIEEESYEFTDIYISNIEQIEKVLSYMTFPEIDLQEIIDEIEEEEG